MTVAFPSTLPTIPRAGAKIQPMQGFTVLQTGAGVASITRDRIDVPYIYEQKIKLTGTDAISTFETWLVRDVANGALEFMANLLLPNDTTSATNVRCRFADPPNGKDVGDHIHRVREYPLKLFIYDAPHATVTDNAGVWPTSVPAPVTQSITENKQAGVKTGLWQDGQTRAGGMEQPAELHKMVSLMSHDQFKTLHGWWYAKQDEGARGFTMPLLTSGGLDDVAVRPMSQYVAKQNAGDVEVTLSVEVTRPIIANVYEAFNVDAGMVANDWQDLSKDAVAVWKAFAGV